MSNIGIKISKPGVDVKTADDKDLVWSSNFKTLKIYRTLKFTSSGSQAHGLDYPPFVISYSKAGFPETDSNEWNSSAASYFQFGTILVSVDEEYVYAPGSSDEPIYVILAIDPLNE